MLGNKRLLLTVASRDLPLPAFSFTFSFWSAVSARENWPLLPVALHIVPRCLPSTVASGCLPLPPVASSCLPLHPVVSRGSPRYLVVSRRSIVSFRLQEFTFGSSVIVIRQFG